MKSWLVGVQARVLLLAFICLLAVVPLSAQPGSAVVPVTDAMLQKPAPEDWLMWRRTLDSWGYSPLDQVTRENVDTIRMIWSRALVPGRHEGAPLAYDGILCRPQASDVIQGIAAVCGTSSHFSGLTPEIRPSRGNNLFVFALAERN